MADNQNRKIEDRTKIIRCRCSSVGQDELYGNRMRLHNWADGNRVWRCTVCLDTKT